MDRPAPRRVTPFRDDLRCVYPDAYLSATPSPAIRYQLLHRIAAAKLEAAHFNAAYAVMLIHTFSPVDANFEDFQAFVGLYGQRAVSDQLIVLTQVEGVQLLTAWVHGDTHFLNA